MIRHLVQIAAITVAALACMFYAFLPGTHDRLAVTLSGMARLLGWAGLLLVPIGALWLLDEIVKAGRAQGAKARTNKGYYFALASLGASFVVAAGVAFAATHTGLSLGLMVLIFWAYL